MPVGAVVRRGRLLGGFVEDVAEVGQIGVAADLVILYPAGHFPTTSPCSCVTFLFELNQSHKTTSECRFGLFGTRFGMFIRLGRWAVGARCVTLGTHPRRAGIEHASRVCAEVWTSGAMCCIL